MREDVNKHFNAGWQSGALQSVFPQISPNDDDIPRIQADNLFSHAKDFDHYIIGNLIEEANLLECIS